MSLLSDVRIAVEEFCAQRDMWLLVSGVYDLFPARHRVSAVQPSLRWPGEWPNGDYHGVYLFFADTPGDPEFLYAGKTSGRTTCLKARLNAYVDMKEYRASGRCVLLDEWHGRKTPWTVEPRYVVTVALETEGRTETCPNAERLEEYLRRELNPSQNWL
jgi:hypothetical protein